MGGMAWRGGGEMEVDDGCPGMVLNRACGEPAENDSDESILDPIPDSLSRSGIHLHSIQ